MGNIPQPADEGIVDRLLAMPEGRTFEVKRVGRNDRKIETVNAFANTDGGLLVLGLEDSERATGRDRVYGIEENAESVDDLKQLIRSRFTPPMASPLALEPTFIHIPCTLRTGAHGSVVVVRVEKSPVVHSFINGGTYETFREKQSSAICCSNN